MSKSRALWFFIIFFSFFSVRLKADTYDKSKQFELYQSANFREKVGKYCHFKTSIVATYRKEIQSLEQAYKIIEKLGDLPNKYKWSPEVDPKGSFLVFPGNRNSGMVYHFVYRRAPGNFLVEQKEGFTDYYRETYSKERFKGCIVASSSPVKFADFEYKVVQEEGKVYIQRSARVVPKINVPATLARRKLEQSNKETLDRVVKQLQK